MWPLCCVFQSDWGGASAAHYSSPALHSAVSPRCISMMYDANGTLHYSTLLPHRSKHPHWLFHSNRQTVIHLPFTLLSQSWHLPLHISALRYPSLDFVSASISPRLCSSYKEHKVTVNASAYWLLQKMCHMNYCGSKQQRCFHTCPLLSASEGTTFYFSATQVWSHLRNRTEHASRVSQSE